MTRSAGITVSAVFVFIGSGFTLLFAALACIGAAKVWFGASAAEMPELPDLVKYFMLFFIALMFAMAAWGIASGVGVLRLREWARVSILVFSVLLACFCLGSILFVGFLPLPNARVSAQQMHVFRLGAALFYGFFAAVGVGWIYFFNTKSVKDQFRRGTGPDGSILRSPTRPVSITIVACFLLVMAVCSPIALFFPLPVIAFGVVFTGRASSVLFMIYFVIQLLAGVGLLKLRVWARVLTVWYFSVCIGSTLLSELLPGRDVRMEKVQENIESLTQIPVPHIHTPMWLPLLVGIVMFAVPLWFVTTRKQAFLQNREPAAPIV